MPRLMSHFSDNGQAYGADMSTRRSGNWDEATLGAPAEDPEYGATESERVLAMVPGGGFQYKGEKNQITKTTSITEVSEHQHSLEREQQGSSSESSSPLRK